MNIEQLRKLCLSFPGTTEQVQWGDNLLFKVGGRMFVVLPLEPSRIWITFKANPEAFVELTERPGVIPAPYLARAKWIALESRDAMSDAEVSELLRQSYEMVLAKLPQKLRHSATQGKAAKSTSKPKRKPKSRRKLPSRKSRK